MNSHCILIFTSFVALLLAGLNAQVAPPRRLDIYPDFPRDCVFQVTDQWYRLPESNTVYIGCARYKCFVSGDGTPLLDRNTDQISYGNLERSGCEISNQDEMAAPYCKRSELSCPEGVDAPLASA